MTENMRGVAAYNSMFVCFCIAYLSKVQYTTEMRDTEMTSENNHETTALVQETGGSNVSNSSTGR